MSEQTHIPQLTLDPEGSAAAAAAPAPAAGASAPAASAPAAPTLTLGNEPAQQQEAEPVVIDESMLTEEERRAVDAFAEKIDITDATQVMQYGSAAQKNIAQFSETALGSVRTKDLGSVSRPCPTWCWSSSRSPSPRRRAAWGASSSAAGAAWRR